MLALLPTGDRTIFYANVAALRQAEMLNLLSGVKTAPEREYADFVRQTQFDYTRDLATVAGAFDDRETFIVARGRFDWTRLQRYAAEHGGSCAADVCRVATKTARRWASFLPIQPDVLGMALSEQSSMALTLRPPGRSAFGTPPPQPVWVKVSQSLLKNPASLPPPLRIFAIAVQFANPVILSLSPAEDSRVAFDVRLDASCANSAAADTVRNQLQIETKMLKLALAREHQEPSPADLAGLLTSGTFQVVDRRVVGIWPFSKELLKALQ